MLNLRVIGRMSEDEEEECIGLGTWISEAPSLYEGLSWVGQGPDLFLMPQPLFLGSLFIYHKYRKGLIVSMLRGTTGIK